MLLKVILRPEASILEVLVAVGAEELLIKLSTTMSLGELMVTCLPSKQQNKIHCEFLHLEPHWDNMSEN